MEEKSPNIFSQLAQSLYQFKAYPGFIQSGGGKIFLYSLLMTVIVYLSTFVVPTWEGFGYVFRLDTSFVDEHVPWFEVRNGQFFIEEEFLFDDYNMGFLFYATSDYYISSQQARDVLRGYTQGIIIGPDRMVIKQFGNNFQEYEITPVLEFSRNDLYTFIPIVKFILVFVYVLVFLVLLAAYMVGVLFCTLLGMAVNAYVKAPAGFHEIFKLTTYARTVPILVRTLFFFLPFGFNFVFFYLLFGVYIFMALTEMKKIGTR
jgi:hypothetical protein